MQHTTLGEPVGIGRTAEVYAWGNGQILKLYRMEIPREWVWREAKVGRIVAEAGLAAPAIGEVIEIGDRLGIVYERVSGPSMLDLLSRSPWTLRCTARQFAELHAAMHACHRPELPGQRASLIHQIEHAPTLPGTVRQGVLAALSRLTDDDTVCHGDYHPDNVIASARGPVVIDWMTATRGNHVADVARTVLLFRVGVLPQDMPAGKRVATEIFRRAFLGAYLRSYCSLCPVSNADIERWIPVLAAARLNEHVDAEEAVLLRLASAASQP